ncbi:MAG: hypothetical protein KKF85_13540 [Gammaproteobacteria bacterium]|nr:hypothetical protein [Rhodocyclaceae bacterium]MBU3909468.1 hypothetical protein [Gammaproteobacteria bacterium]MBU4003723.1 hypothetical protein [Gammaproteobacteria bacterium]MBU4022180.1 hypothetical protein [Gammaproteobacteria bacterium]MBU4097487.1 hypothetical protein [Gammaproteobacteria bacterium]
MEISYLHSLEYSTKGDVPVSVVAKNLLANERLIHESVRVLGDCIDGLQVQKITVKVAHVSNTSPLKEVFALALFVTYQKDLEKEVPTILQQVFGYQAPNGMEALVTVTVLLVAMYIINTAVERLFPGKEVKRLKEEYEIKLLELARMTGIDASTIEANLKKRLSEGKLKSLIKKAYEFFSPAKAETDAEILVKGEVAVPRDAIDEIPTEIEIAQTEAKNVYELSDVEIDIHRSDIDYAQSGWIAVIDEVSDKRKKLVLSPDLAPADLFGVKKIRGDVLVIEEMSDEGEYVIKEFHLMKCR